MNWIKKGLVYEPNQKYDWNKSHAQVPVVDLVDEEIWRIYYATRNAQNQSNTSYIEVEAGNPSNILYEHHKPILPLGKIGTFDDSGIMPSSIISVGEKKFLYYVGWTKRTSVPYHNSVGLAVSIDNGKTFKKAFEGPIIATTHTEPYFTGTCFVLKENEIFHAWYLSCTGWEIIDKRPEPFYHIKYASSRDGINWNRQGIVAIDYINKAEAGIVSASVIKEGDKYLMWYAYRKAIDYRTDSSQSYRIGYAESTNGVNWKRMDDKSGIDVSKDGWDSNMISYPYLIQYKNLRYMFYNGNGFGKTGFGYATAKG